ncbi:MAG: DUF5615 family PIN-like protein [Promethearchaeota archaeon]
MVQNYLLDEMLNGKENVCNNLRMQGKTINKLPKNMHGFQDDQVVQYAKKNRFKLITKDRGCAREAKINQVHVILIKD